MRMHVFLFLHIVDVVQFTNEGASWCKYPIKHTNLILMWNFGLSAAEII